MEVIASTVEVIWELGYICSSAVLICITDGTRPFASTTGGVERRMIVYFFVEFPSSLL